MVFQGIFHPIVPYSKFIVAAKNNISFIDNSTLKKYENKDSLTFYDEAQIVHALNLSKFDFLNESYEYFSGFSLGIYSALVASKKIERSISFDIIRRRALILQSAVDYEWDIYLVVGVAVPILDEFVRVNDNKAYISTISSNKHTTLAIKKQYSEEMIFKLKELKAIAIEKYLENSAWHTKVIHKKKEELADLYRDLGDKSTNRIVFSQADKHTSLSMALEGDCYTTVDFRNVIKFCIERVLSITIVDETENLEKIFFTNTREKNYKVIRCAQ